MEELIFVSYSETIEIADKYRSLSNSELYEFKTDILKVSESIMQTGHNSATVDSLQRIGKRMFHLIVHIKVIAKGVVESTISKMYEYHNENEYWSEAIKRGDKSKEMAITINKTKLN